MKDTAKHQGLRNQLVTLLKEKGIVDKSVLEAIGKIPRHLFLNSSFADYAYQDKAFPIGAARLVPFSRFGASIPGIGTSVINAQ